MPLSLLLGTGFHPTLLRVPRLARMARALHLTRGTAGMHLSPVVTLPSRTLTLSRGLFAGDDPAATPASTAATDDQRSSSFSTDFLDDIFASPAPANNMSPPNSSDERTRTRDARAHGRRSTDNATPFMARRASRSHGDTDPAIEKALARVKVSSNNTIVTITREDGLPLLTVTAGMCGFKGARKSTSYAARVVGSRAGQAAIEKGVRTVSVLVKGLGPGRVNAVKGLVDSRLKIDLVSDVTPVPHNGCRPKKARRL